MLTNNIIIIFLIYFVPVLILGFGVIVLVRNIIFYVKTAYYGTPTTPERRKQFTSEVFLSFGCMILGTIVLLIIISLPKVSANNEATASTSEVSVASEGYFETYNQAVNNVEFKSEVINKDQTLWEDILDDYLYYDYYKKWTTEPIAKRELRKQYLSHFGESGVSPSVSLEDVIGLINIFYGTDMFPITEHTLEEIDEKIPPLEERIEADPAIATEEFLLRVFSCTTSSSNRELYQAGRAIDDVYKQKEHQETVTIKESILLPALSIALYDLSLQEHSTSKNADYSFTSYKTAELVICLEDYSVFIWGNDDYSIHFLLFAEARLKCAENTYIIDETHQNIRKDQPYLSYYLAKTQYELIGYCDPENDKILIEELTAECVKYCYDYINSPYTKVDCVTSCRDIVRELEGQDNIEYSEQ